MLSCLCHRQEDWVVFLSARKRRCGTFENVRGVDGDGFYNCRQPRRDLEGAQDNLVLRLIWPCCRGCNANCGYFERLVWLVKDVFPTQFAEVQGYLKLLMNSKNI